jgi:MtrB/PioB family decaheme-associated outer membrane protein
MKKLLSALGVMGALFGLAVGAASAQDKAADGWVIKARAVAGTEFVGATDASSKFTEYRDVPNGFIFDAFDLSLTKGNRYFTLSADRIRQRDGRYIVTLGDYGKYDVDFTWNQIPHRYSFDAQTLYVQEPAPTGPGVYPGTGVFYYGLPDAIQLADQNAGSNAAARALWSQYLAGVHDVDLGVQRNKGTLKLTYNPSVPVTLSLTASRETTQGTREMSATFGFNNAIELPEPINYITSGLSGKVEYAQKWATVQAGYDLSVFDNENTALIWDNPYRLTDQTYSTPTAAYVNGDGTSRGQMALEPSNNAQRFFLNGVVKVLKYTKISASFSYGIFSQNENLLPYTINTALANPAVGDPSALQAPRPTAMAKADVTSLNLGVNSRLVKSVYVSAGFRYYDFANKTEPLNMPGLAIADEVWESAAALGAPYAIQPYSYQTSKAFADLTWNFMKDASLKFSYTFSRIGRQIGEEVPGTPPDRDDENTFKASLDSNPLDWLLVRVSYLHASRTWSLTGIEEIYPTFDFQRYFEANRNRNAVDALVGLSLTRNLDLEVSYMLGNDTFPASDYGLKASDFTLYGADLTYVINKSASVYGFYSYELYRANQADRQSNPDGSFSTNPANDWSALLKDGVNTFGGGLKTVLVRDKLNLDVSYSYSYAKGTADLYSPPGGTPDLAVNFTNNNLDSTGLQILRSQIEWKVMPRLSIIFGYWYEQYNLKDITRDDYAVDFAVLGGTYLGALEPSYKYNVGSVRFSYSW